jgi:hypothetical protein
MSRPKAKLVINGSVPHGILEGDDELRGKIAPCPNSDHTVQKPRRVSSYFPLKKGVKKDLQHFFK